jgi:hypothetical protein
MTKPSISHTLLSWKHGSNPSLLLWDTIQENHPELSSAMEVLLRKISPTSEVFDRKLRSLEEVLFKQLVHLQGFVLRTQRYDL